MVLLRPCLRWLEFVGNEAAPVGTGHPSVRHRQILVQNLCRLECFQMCERNIEPLLDGLLKPDWGRTVLSFEGKAQM